MNVSKWSELWSVPVERASVLMHQLRSQLTREFSEARGRKIRLSVPDLMAPPRSVGNLLLGEMGVDLTPLPEDLQHLITNTSCQHRIELFQQPGDIQCLAKYDGRLMYLGCCTGLGVAGGRYRHVEGEDIQDNERGRARVWFKVPGSWEHVGLLAVKRGDDGWVWPQIGENYWETWADVSEIRFARKQGWRVDVLEKIVWPEDRPLDLWAARLSRLYLRAKEAEDYELAGCYRCIGLHTIGGFHNLGYRDCTHVVAEKEHTGGVGTVVGVCPEGIRVRRRVAFDKDPYLIHPEWSAAIWSRARLRVARALLSVPYDRIHGVYGDAIYTSAETVPHGRGEPWFDDGAAGRFRLAWWASGRRPAPKSWNDIQDAS